MTTSGWRSRARLACLIVTGLSAARAGAQAPPPKFNPGELRKGVVFVKRIAPGVEPASGSGFLVTKDGLVFTNRHVAVPDAPAAGTVVVVGVPSAKDPDELSYYRAEVVYATGAKDGRDFAALRIAGKPGADPFPALPLGAGKPGLGDDVAVLGYPVVKADRPAVAFNKGSVSSARVVIDGAAYYQTDAAVNPGNSGGPLVTPAGEVVGLVTLKKRGADNIGFALHLGEVAGLREEVDKRAKAAAPPPGPLSPDEAKALAPPVIAPKTANWAVGAGTVKEGRGGPLIVENNGGTYWVVSKDPLPDDFQLTVGCGVEFLQGRQVLQPSQKSVLRMLCIRFATDDTKTDILEPKGNLLQFSHSHLLLWKDGEVLKSERTGNPDDPFTLTLTKQGGTYTVVVNGKVLLAHRDDKPLKGGHKLCIGGYTSRLYLGEVTVVPLGAKGDKPDPGKK